MQLTMEAVIKSQDEGSNAINFSKRFTLSKNVQVAEQLSKITTAVTEVELTMGNVGTPEFLYLKERNGNPFTLAYNDALSSVKLSNVKSAMVEGALSKIQVTPDATAQRVYDYIIAGTV